LIAVSGPGGARRRQSPTGEWQYQGADGYWYDEPETTSAPNTSSGPSQIPAPNPASLTSAIPVGAWMAIIGSVLAGAGTLLSWGSLSIGAIGVDRNAFQLGSGKSVTWVGPIIIILAVIGLLIGIARLINATMPLGLQTSALVLGVCLAIVVGVNYPTEPAGVPSSVAGVSVVWSVGVGFWLSLIGAVIIFGGGVVMRVRQRPREDPDESKDARMLKGW
jgi:hypothetical protein